MAFILYGLTPGDVAQDPAGNVQPGEVGHIYGTWATATLWSNTFAVQPDLTVGSATGGEVTADELGRFYWFTEDHVGELYLEVLGVRWPVNPTRIGDAVAQQVAAATAGLQDQLDDAIAGYQATIDDLVATVDDIATKDPQAIAVNVATFGALGDGGTNDRDAFQAAIDSLTAVGGGHLLVPGGKTYVIDGVVELASNIHIRGEGAIITKTAPSPYSVFVALSHGATGYGSSVENVTVTGLRFLGSLPAGLFLCPFALHHARNVLIENCVFDQVQGTGHTMDLGGCENITVRNCDFIGFDNPLTSGFSRAEAIQLDYSAKGGISFPDDPGSYDGLPTRRVTVQNCRFLPITVGPTTYPGPNPVGSHSVREGQFFEDVWVINNLIVDPINHDPNLETYLYGVIHFVAARRVKIIGNTLVQTDPTRTNRAICLVGAATGVLAGSDPNGDETTGTLPTPMACSDVIIESNDLTGFKPQNASTYCDTVTLRGLSGTPMLNVRIASNNFRDGRNTSGATSPLKYAIRAHFVHGLTAVGNVIRDDNGGMLIQSTPQVSVQGNSLIDVWFRGLTFTSATRVTAIGNTLEGTGAASSIGIQNTSATDQIVILGNVITDFATDVNNSTSPAAADIITASNI